MIRRSFGLSQHRRRAIVSTAFLIVFIVDMRFPSDPNKSDWIGAGSFVGWYLGFGLGPVTCRFVRWFLKYLLFYLIHVRK
jgi:hypothetical protein